MELHKNELLQIHITGMTAEGFGVGRIHGIAVFVPLTAPGDIAEIRIVKTEKRFAYGRLEKLITPSQDRTEPDCPVFAQCGGCCYRHISYAAELRIKEERVRDALTRIGGLSDPQLKPILGADSRDGYRNKACLLYTSDAADE